MKVVDNLPRFKRNLYSVLDDAFNEAGRDVLIKARTRAPFQQGPLRSNSDTHKVKPLHQRISFWLEYARFQEFGGDGVRRVRNYSTPGTGKGYLKTSGDEVAKKLNMTFRKHAQRAK